MVVLDTAHSSCPSFRLIVVIAANQKTNLDDNIKFKVICQLSTSAASSALSMGRGARPCFLL